MKSKMSKKLIAFILCMVLVICNSVSILADTPAPEATTTAQQTKTAGENSDTKKKTTDGTENVSAQSEDSADTKKPSDEDPAPEVKTTEEKKETTEASTEKKEDSTAADEEKDDPAEVTTKAKADTDKTDEPTTETTTGEQDETKGAEESSTKGKEETDGSNVAGGTAETSEPSEATTEVTPAETTSTETIDATSSALELKNAVDDAVITVRATEGVFPEGTTFTARKIEVNTKEYSKVEKSLEKEAEKKDKDVLDFVAYDITFTDAEGTEIEPNGNVQVSIEFNDVTLGGAEEKNTTVNVVHIKDDASTETVKSDVNIKKEQLKTVDFTTDEFSIYAVTTSGISPRYDSTIQVNDWAVIEFWDKKGVGGYQDIAFEGVYTDEYDSNSRYLKIEVYLENQRRVSKTYQLDMNDDAYDDNVNLQTTVKPGEGYYLAQACHWQKAGSEDVSTFGGSGSTGMNQAGKNPKVNTLTIYLTRTNPNPNCGRKISDSTKPISVDLYNYDTEAYNKAVDLDSGSLLLRSAWGNYKADGYEISEGGNAHNASCGKTGIYYGLVQPSLEDENIVFNKKAKFFDDQFDSSVGTKYSDIDFEFIYDESTGEYSYNSENNHVHFDEVTNTISQYNGAGPGTLSDGSDFTKNGFFPFTDESDNMTDYGFGMRMDVEFQLTEDGTIGGSKPMEFSFSGDDDVWVFIDGELALDLGGLHSRRGGTINFEDKSVTYDQVTYKEGDSSITVDATPVEGTSRPDTTFLETLKPGTHTLTMYYLERGGNDSNCEIKFNLLVVNRKGTLEFEKVDDENQSLEGAVFGLYDTETITDQTEPIATAESEADGNVVFDISGLDEGTYYLQEIAAPWGYIADDTIYTVTITESTSSTSTNIIMEGKISNNNTGQNIQMIPNQKRTTGGGTTTVEVEKKWGNGVTDNQKVPVTVTLKGDEKTVPSGNSITNPIELNNDNQWKHTWTNLPGSVNYTVEESAIPGFNASYSTDSSYVINEDFNKYAPDSTDNFQLGGNGVIVIKKGNTHYIWTAVQIPSEEQSDIAAAIEKTELRGIGDIDTIEYGYGTYTFNNVISFTYNEENQSVGLKFLNNSARSLFWAGTYNETKIITVQNDKVDQIDIPVEKIWDESVLETDKGTVKVGLYKEGETTFVQEEDISSEEDWMGTFENVPYWDTTTGGKIQYTVKEISIDGTAVENTGFQVTVDQKQDGSFTVTNSKTTPWQIIKVSKTDGSTVLSDAVFKLEKNVSSSEEPITEEPVTYYGKSNEEGKVEWYTDINCSTSLGDTIPSGTYTLSEIQAPVGYSIADMTWTINIGAKVTITKNGGENDEPLRGTTDDEGVLTFTIENEALYSLPSAGGSGIYWYTFSGTLLMMGAALIVYREKRKREVLLRK